MQKMIIVGVIGIAILGVGFFVFNTFVSNEAETEDPTAVEEPYQATLSGEYVCLTPAGATEPNTNDCTYGLRTDSGEYYSIIFNVASEENVALELGDRFTADGLVTPLSHIRTDQWEHPLEGIFSITGSVQIQTDSEEENGGPVTTKECYVGGCSGQLCTDQPDAVSTCEYREEYACYETATCEVQQDGECGWTETPALRACLNA